MASWQVVSRGRAACLVHTLGWVWVLLLFLGCQPTAVPARRPITPSVNKMGIHLLLADGRHQWPAGQWPEHLQAARTAVGEWGYVTQLVTLDDLDVAKWQTFMDLCADLHLTPILRLATTYDSQQNVWRAPPLDKNARTYHSTARQYADFAAALTWPTAEHIVVVGNEPNHGDEWGGRPDPAAYGQFLQDTAIAIKGADPQARILNAGLDPYAPHSGSQPLANGLWYMDSETFLDEMAAAHPHIFDHLDGWASHPYPLGPFIMPPWQQTYGVDYVHDAHNPRHTTPPAGVYNRGVNGYVWELWQLAGYGVTDLPVFITETGWRHTAEPYPAPEVVAVYLQLAFYGRCHTVVCPPHTPTTGWTPWLEDTRVIAVTPFALDGHPAEWAHTNWLYVSTAGQVNGWAIPWPPTE